MGNNTAYNHSLRSTNYLDVIIKILKHFLEGHYFICD